MKNRTQDSCPKCKSKLKAIVGTNLVCIGLGCDYIYRKDVKDCRVGDKTIIEIKENWK